MNKADIQKIALDKAITHMRCGIAMSMGTGKTLVGLQYIDYFAAKRDVRVLVAAPKKSIFMTWLDEMEKFNMGHLIDMMEFTTYISMPKKDTNYDILILDECHSLTPACIGYLKEHTGKILGLTGSPPKDFSEKGQIVSAFCPIVYEYFTDDAVEDGLLNDYRIVVHTMPLNNQKALKKTRKDGGTWMTSEVADYAYWTNRLYMATPGKEEQIMRVMRMKALMNFPTKEVYAKKLFNSIDDKCILFANTMLQADKLCNHRHHSKDPCSEENLEMFKEGEITKLAAVLQLSEGVNIPGLKACIILHSYSGGSAKTLQRLGRCLRLSTDDVATIHILAYSGTVDEKWVRDSLVKFDQSKITWQVAGTKQLV